MTDGDWGPELMGQSAKAASSNSVTSGQAGVIIIKELQVSARCHRAVCVLLPNL
jgi:hypothetical protein